MSLCQKTNRGCASVALVLALVLIALPSMLNAQTAAPNAPTVQSGDTFPKVELFLGYQWLNPGGSVPDQTPPPTGPLALQLPGEPGGFGVNVSYNFTKNLALEANYGENWKTGSANTTAGMIGPKFVWRGEGMDFFVHTLVGFDRVRPDGVKHSLGVGALLGGGIDFNLCKAVKLRLFEADFQWAHEDFGSVVPPTDSSLRRSDFDGVRLTTGLVFNFGGGAPEVPVAAACSVQPSAVLAGEPVNATVVASNFNPKHTLTYAWATSGGKIAGTGTGATIDTTGVSGGGYATTVTVTDPRAMKNNVASCTAPFTVRELSKNPPQISCSANPSMVQAGTSATIACICTSPDNVPVTVGGWTSSGGSISGRGNSATLNTTGASSGPITIGATCTDARGLTASTTASVTVENLPPAAPQATKVNECLYPNLKKPWRVDNTCKAELDDVALKLQQDPDAKLVVVGNAGPKEMRKNLAAERALNVKAYISGGEAKQNIDPSRIETRIGNAGTANSEQWIVPAGATFPEAGTTTRVDEKKVKAVPDHPKPVAKKAAKKAG
jgi:hypothetical protein